MSVRKLPKMTKLQILFFALLVTLTFDGVYLSSRIKRSSWCSDRITYLKGYKVKSSMLSLFWEPECESPPQLYHGFSTVCNWIIDEWKGYTSWRGCPTGTFMQKQDGSKYLCCSPSAHPARYEGMCRDLTVQPNSDLVCDSGYYVTRTYDKMCDGDICSTNIECCKMYNPLPPVESVENLKRRIQRDMLVPMSLLAYYLGFGRCGGCRGLYVGENFKETDAGWQADKTGSCPGYKDDQWLRIDFSDWKILNAHPAKFEIPQEHNPVKVTARSFNFVNNVNVQQTKYISEKFDDVHTVRHYTGSKVTMSHEATVSVKFQYLFVKTSSVYTFGYEDTQVNANEVERGETKTTTYAAKLVVPPCSETTTRWVITYGKATQRYSVDVDTLFSASFHGFLRETNFHYKYRGIREKPSVSHHFGDSDTSFYEDFTRQMDGDETPWQWKNMVYEYPIVRDIRDRLANETRYRMTLNGKFEEVALIDISVYADSTPLSSESCVQQENQGGERVDVADNDNDDIQGTIQDGMWFDSFEDTKDPKMAVLEVLPAGNKTDDTRDTNRTLTARDLLDEMEGPKEKEPVRVWGDLDTVKDSDDHVDRNNNNNNNNNNKGVDLDNYLVPLPAKKPFNQAATTTACVCLVFTVLASVYISV